MTNLEWLKKNLSEEEKSNVQMCVVFNEKIYKNTCNGKDCYDCPLNKVGDLIDLLLQEHKEPIKLKQWEKDLISLYDKDDECYSIDYGFSSFLTLNGLKEKGYFKGITDTSMTIKEILKNCEVIE
ncbi:hypothetical protein B5F14_01740 [Faecalitalea cylindroides]|uniref:Uncharacterized protein n=1 Tax=Faecalitalea cylindroides TaxID=39483 RepID=A0A1Y4LYN9_9FIRM|nr:hypothetical protein [Faecalitalea cylindroides]OUP61704.1 hypothetical protein B5F14_01740 [Faecalitalea cylindroides]